ncbi:MAG: hypothetical protein RL748_2076 [Pseudomonadota bacterium]
MNDAKMNDAAGLLELTAMEVGVVVGGVGEDPSLPKLTWLTNLATIGADPPPPTR